MKRTRAANASEVLSRIRHARRRGTIRTLAEELQEEGFDLHSFLTICSTCQGNVQPEDDSGPPRAYLIRGLLEDGRRGIAAVVFLDDGTVLVPLISEY